MNTKPEELNLDEAFLEPEDMEGFVNRAMFRDAEFSVKRIGGTPEDPKFTHHTLNFKGPNWFGWIRIVVIGKAWREQAARWFTISVFARRLDGPMFMSQNERNETAVDLGKDFHYGKIKELPTPESLYPYLEAALDENQEMFQGFEVTSDEDIDKVVYRISLSIIHLLKGAHILNEAIDPDEFMSPVINQGGFRPMRWKLFKGYVARGDEKWFQNHYILPVGSFDDKIYGDITFVMDVDSPDDIEKADGMCKFSTRFELSTGSLKQHRHDAAVRKVRRRDYERRGGEEPWPYIMPNHEAWLEVSYRAKPEWIPDIKKAYELLVSKYWRPLLDQRDDQGNPMLKQNEEALRKEFMEVFNHKNEIGESISLTPGEFEEFGEVASDIQYASAWRKANGGINNRFIDLWACDLSCPLKHPFTGYLTVYKGTEDPFILHVGIKDEYHRGKYIVGYLKGEPSERVLDKIRAAAIQQIKAYLAGEDFPGNAVNIAKQFAAAIQAHISGDPEVYALNYTERTNESEEMDVGGFVDDFLTREGLQEWQPQGTILNQHAQVVVNTGMGFKFDNLAGVVTYIDYWQHENRINMVYVNIIDSYAGENWSRYYGTGDTNTRFHITVPENQVDKLKAALEAFIGKDVRALNQVAVAAGSTLLPNQSRRIALALRKALRPWIRVLESVNPEEIGDEFVAHGGPPLEWQEIDHEGRQAWKMRLNWMDYTHAGMIKFVPTPQLGRDMWMCRLVIGTRTEGEEFYDNKVVFQDLVRLNAKLMPQWFKKMEAFAKWLIATFNRENPVVDTEHVTLSGQPGTEQHNEIKRQFDMATNWTDLKEALDPGEFIKDFDVEGVMRPWVTNDYTQVARMHPHIHHSTVIEHPDKRRPFNDKVTLNVDYFLSHDTGSGMPTEPYVIITGTYAHRGWTAKEMRDIWVKFKTDKEVLPVVDELARHYLLPKITKNAGTPGMFTFFRRKLATALAAKGWLVEARISGREDLLDDHGKYWLDRNGEFHEVSDHEEIAGMLPDDGWKLNYNTDVEIDYAYQEAIKRGYVRVQVGHEGEGIWFNPPATDQQITAMRQAAQELGVNLVADYGNRGNRVIWAPTQESLQGLTFRSECRGAHSGQTDMTIYAEYNGDVVGRVEYAIFDGGIYVQHIKTMPEYRRQGVATALAKKLQQEYPDTEIEWGGSTEMGTPFIASLNREFEPEPQYGPLKKAYDDAKAEQAALQKEFDDWTAAGKGKLPPEMLLKGERMNEIENFLWDLEDKLRDLKPGRWMIRESVEPEEFYQGFELEHSVQGWTGSDINTSTSGGSYLYVNRTGLLGRFNFNAYIRPNERNDIRLDSSFSLSCWAHSVGSSQTIGSAECPDIWIRLSPTEGMPSFQPSNINGFLSDFKQAAQDFAKEGCAQPDAVSVSRFLFTAIFKRLKKQGWKMDVDKHGAWWDLGEGLEWSSDDMADIARKATTVWGEWQERPFMGTHGQEGTDWVFHVYAPEGRLYKENNYIRLRFYKQEPGENHIKGGLESHFVAPYYFDFDTTTPSSYDHSSLSKPFIIPPGEEENFRKSIEEVFNRVVVRRVMGTTATKFRLRSIDLAWKQGVSRVINKWWPAGAIYM